MTKSRLHYIVRKPKITADKAPLIILIHGYGSNEEDLFSFASELPDALFVVAVRAPFDLQPYGHAWYAINFTADNEKISDNEQAKVSRDLLADFIDQVCENYPVDATNVTLLGFSQGTILSYSLALSYPKKIKNIIALSGYINEEITTIQKPDAYKHLDFYIAHGTVDQVIPVSWANKAPGYLEALAIKNCYTEFPIGHSVSPQGFFDLKKWLAARI
jgi:phospholipase/carboxylesterase